MLNIIYKRENVYYGKRQAISVEACILPGQNNWIKLVQIKQSGTLPLLPAGLSSPSPFPRWDCQFGNGIVSTPKKKKKKERESRRENSFQSHPCTVWCPPSLLFAQHHCGCQTVGCHDTFGCSEMGFLIAIFDHQWLEWHLTRRFRTSLTIWLAKALFIAPKNCCHGNSKGGVAHNESFCLHLWHRQQS